LAIKADYPDALINLAQVLALQGRRDEAVARLRRALELAKSRGDAALVATAERQLAAVGEAGAGGASIPAANPDNPIRPPPQP